MAFREKQWDEVARVVLTQLLLSCTVEMVVIAGLIWCIALVVGYLCNYPDMKTLAVHMGIVSMGSGVIAAMALISWRHADLLKLTGRYRILAAILDRFVAQGQLQAVDVQPLCATVATDILKVSFALYWVPQVWCSSPERARGESYKMVLAGIVSGVAAMENMARRCGVDPYRYADID